MARPPDLRRIQKEDFEEEIQETIDKLAFPLNNFMEQTRSALDGNLDFNNLNQEIITVDVMVDSNGKPTMTTKYKSGLNTNVVGHNCINAINLTSSTTYPTSSPFISYAQNANLVTLLNISGLQANNKYRLTLISIGSQN